MSITNIVSNINRRVIDAISKEKAFPPFRVGDTISAKIKVVDGTERIATVSGICIRHSQSGITSYFDLRKICDGGVAIERRIPIFSPLLISFSVERRGKVRRAVLSYLAKARGAMKVKERFSPHPRESKSKVNS